MPSFPKTYHFFLPKLADFSNGLFSTFRSDCDEIKKRSKFRTLQFTTAPAYYDFLSMLSKKGATLSEVFIDSS